MEEGKDLIGAVPRETLEETGVTMDLGPLAAAWAKLRPPSPVIFNFLAFLSGGNLTRCEECPESAGFPPT